jgi:hypothetical protein
MGDIDIHIGEAGDAEPEPEPTPEPVLVPVPDVAAGLATAERIGAVEAKLDALMVTLAEITDFVQRIETLEEVQAEALDDIADDETEDISDIIEQLEEDDNLGVGEEPDGTEETGAPSETDSGAGEQNGAASGGSEDTTDEPPRATHPWFRPVRG